MAWNTAQKEQAQDLVADSPASNLQTPWLVTVDKSIYLYNSQFVCEHAGCCGGGGRWREVYVQDENNNGK